MIQPGSVLTLEVEKPAAGGRMLARHNGQIVLVWGAVPGERIRARVERATKSVLFGETVEVLSASPNRRAASADWRCGGMVLAHVAYEHQLALKAEIIQDAFGRIGRIPLPSAPPVIASPERGYRMRARLHAANGRIGFYREGTHALCGVSQTRQLSDATHAWIARAEEIAQMIGTTRETVTRLLSDFKRRNVIEVKGSTILILQKSELERMVSI